MSVLFVIALIIVLLVALFFGLLLLHDLHSMKYSQEADLALKEFIDELRPALLEKHKGVILQVERRWNYGYPGIALLGTTDEALRTLLENNAFEWIKDKPGKAIKDDARFGSTRRRKSFDQEKCIFAMSSMHAGYEERWRNVTTSKGVSW